MKSSAAFYGSHERNVNSTAELLGSADSVTTHVCICASASARLHVFDVTSSDTAVNQCSMLFSGVTMFGALPVALLVKSPGVLALVSQASVAFVFFFAAVVAALSLAPSQHNGESSPLHAVKACQSIDQAVHSLVRITIHALLCVHCILLLNSLPFKSLSSA